MPGARSPVYVDLDVHQWRQQPRGPRIGRSPAPKAAATASRLARVIRRWAADVAAIRDSPVPALVLGIVAGIVVIGILGAYDAVVTDVPQIDLQEELDDTFSIPTLYSGGVLLVLVWVTASVALDRYRNGRSPWVFVGLALIFLEASADEMVEIHERIGNALPGDWEILYIPVFVLAGLLWLAVYRELAGRPEQTLWLAAAVCFVGALVLEAYAQGGTGESGRPGSGVFGAFEELLEPLGTTLFIWTMLRIRSSATSVRGSTLAPS